MAQEFGYQNRTVSVIVLESKLVSGTISLKHIGTHLRCDPASDREATKAVSFD
jgi:hypothetical protein